MCDIEDRESEAYWFPREFGVQSLSVRAFHVQSGGSALQSVTSLAFR